MIHRIFIFLLALIVGEGIFLPVRAQQGAGELGQWQVHVPYNRAKALAEVDGKIYCAAEDGFFLFDPEFNETRTLTKADGFHNINVSTLAYDGITQTLVIAYEDSHLDLIRNNQIIPIPDIARKPIAGEKIIHHIAFRGKRAYLSSTFGVVVLDLEKLEIKETYSNLGPGGQSLTIYGSTTLRDSIYLATSNGIMAASLSGPNLLDYKSWRTFNTAEGLPPNINTKTIATFADHVYAGLNQQGVYLFNGKTWQPTAAVLTGKDAFQLTPTQNALLIANQENILLLSAENQVEIYDDPLLEQPRAALQSKDGTYWLADYARGLVHQTGTKPLCRPGPIPVQHLVYIPLRRRFTCWKVVITNRTSNVRPVRVFTNMAMVSGLITRPGFSQILTSFRQSGI
jgi:hypothetical protein